MASLSRRPALVRLTHWVNAVSFVALVVSGVAILLAHPRLYWGETGAIGAPSLVDLPLPMLLTGQSGWGRYLHFLAAWGCVLSGLVYASAGLLSGRFRRDLLPKRGGAEERLSIYLWPRRPASAEDLDYNPAQRLAYSMVIFVLVPAMVWTGLAMSPAVSSVLPVFVITVGGQQSARTMHFVIACALVLFALGHVAMVLFSGFVVRMRGMITGRREIGVRA